MGLFSRLFLGTGRLPAGLQAELRADGLLVLEEGCRGSITYRHYRAPGRRSSFRLVGLVAAVAVTSRRLLVHGRSGPIVDVGWDQPQAEALDVSADGGRLKIAFEAGLFHADQSGRVEVSLRCGQAARVVSIASERRSRSAGQR